MANPKIDSIKLPGNTTKYDFDLPTTATPSITSLTIGSLSSTSSTALTVYGQQYIDGSLDVWPSLEDANLHPHVNIGFNMISLYGYMGESYSLFTLSQDGQTAYLTSLSGNLQSGPAYSGNLSIKSGNNLLLSAGDQLNIYSPISVRIGAGNYNPTTQDAANNGYDYIVDIEDEGDFYVNAPTECTLSAASLELNPSSTFSVTTNGSDEVNAGTISVYEKKEGIFIKQYKDSSNTNIQYTTISLVASTNYARPGGGYAQGLISLDAPTVELKNSMLKFTDTTSSAYSCGIYKDRNSYSLKIGHNWDNADNFWANSDIISSVIKKDRVTVSELNGRQFLVIPKSLGIAHNCIINDINGNAYKIYRIGFLNCNTGAPTMQGGDPAYYFNLNTFTGSTSSANINDVAIYIGTSSTSSTAQLTLSNVYLIALS